MTANANSPFGDVIEWFLSRIGDRRQYKRRTGAFHLWWQYRAPDKLKPGIGMEISANGLVFIIEEPIPKPEYTLIVGIRETRIPIRVQTVRADQVDHKGKKWHRYMVNYTGIAADHWDLIVRHINDTAEPPERRKMQNKQMHEKVDDAYRLLPMAIQQKIIEKLVEQKKLEAPKPGAQPLLKLFYGGVQRSPMARYCIVSTCTVASKSTTK